MYVNYVGWLFSLCCVLSFLIRFLKGCGFEIKFIDSLIFITEFSTFTGNLEQFFLMNI